MLFCTRVDWLPDSNVPRRDLSGGDLVTGKHHEEACLKTSHGVGYFAALDTGLPLGKRSQAIARPHAQQTQPDLPDDIPAGLHEMPRSNQRQRVEAERGKRREAAE